MTYVNMILIFEGDIYIGRRFWCGYCIQLYLI